MEGFYEHGNDKSGPINTGVAAQLTASEESLGSVEFVTTFLVLLGSSQYDFGTSVDTVFSRIYSGVGLPTIHYQKRVQMQLVTHTAPHFLPHFPDAST